MIFTHAVCAQEIFRVTSVNFDTSNSLIFLTSPDNTTETIMKNVKLIKLQNPKRAYFDINSAVLTAKPQEWYFNSGGVKHVKISQLSTNPNKIRVVLYLNDNFDASKLSFLKVNNNIVIKFKDFNNKNEYYQNIYRDEKSTSSDFYENMEISSQDLDNIKVAVNSKTNDAALNEIQQAFSTISNQTPNPNIKPAATKTVEEVKKELKLKSKSYLSSISIKPNGFLINGFGAIATEKPMYLTNPVRAVFDLPNTIINPDIRNKEYKFGQDTLKISQFSQNKARIIIQSSELEKYFPIFSSDDQSILFVKTEALDAANLFSKLTDATSYYARKINPTTYELIITFHSPVVTGVKRSDNKLTVGFFNALRYNDKNFRNTVANTGLKEMKMDLLPQVGLKLTMPLEKDCIVKCYTGADGKSVKLILQSNKYKNITVKPTESCNIIEKAFLPRCNGKKSIVLDAGHGGSDYGAIRSGINEKDINLDVAKRIQANLASHGVTVYMTRTTDDFVSLKDRTVITAEKKPEIFVSVHVNSCNGTEATGLETHYYHDNSLDLAQTVHSCLVSHVNSKDRGLLKSRFYVINHTDVPAILVEIGFISNPQERAELVSEQRKQQTANAIAEGIIKYLNKK